MQNLNEALLLDPVCFLFSRFSLVVVELCSVNILCRAPILWVDRNKPLWAIQVSVIVCWRCRSCKIDSILFFPSWSVPPYFSVFFSIQVSVAIISFLETMLLIYLSYKVRKKIRGHVFKGQECFHTCISSSGRLQQGGKWLPNEMPLRIPSVAISPTH